MAGMEKRPFNSLAEIPEALLRRFGTIQALAFNSLAEIPTQNSAAKGPTSLLSILLLRFDIA